MIGRIVEIAEDRRHLAVFRGFLVVNGTEADTWQELGRIPLDNIAALIANAYGISYTNNLLVALAERGTPFVLCANNHNAVGMLLAVEGNYQQAKRYDAQIAITQPRPSDSGRPWSRPSSASKRHSWLSAATPPSPSAL